ncbi:MAG: carbonic anhydrase [Planctomycetota bacterium]
MMPISRRQALAAGATSLATTATIANAQPNDAFRPVPTKDGYTTLSPDEALQFLIDGNDAFLAGVDSNPPMGTKRRLELAKGQSPFCAYVTCSDSRVPPELLFGRGLGELFIIRNAGNTVDTAAMGSIEYAVAVLRVPLIVVMGHESCGAVGAAKKVVDEDARFPGAIDDMIHPILPAVLGVRDENGNIDLEEAVRENVRRVVQRLREESDPLLLEPQKQGKLKVVGAHYDLDRGKVEFFDRPAAS